MIIPAAPNPFGAPVPLRPSNAYAVPRMETVATTIAVIRFVHQGVSGYIGLGVGGPSVPPGPRLVLSLIVYFKRVVLLSINNNGRWSIKDSNCNI